MSSVAPNIPHNSSQPLHPRLAIVQMDIGLGQWRANLEKMQSLFAEARGNGADLVVFPECALTGYCFSSLAKAVPVIQDIPGPATDEFAKTCQTLGGAAVFGLLEKFEGRIYNAAALVTAEGVGFRYRKTHLPYLGVDMFTNYGDQTFQVADVAGLKLGINICYDGGFPEPARCLALKGADLIVLPTNWPPGAELSSEHLVNMRALENTVYYASASRVGTENGVTFIGNSRICDPLGKTIASANGTEETILYADIDPARARQKHLIRTAGSNEVNRIADRRPELYQPLMVPNRLARPGGR